MSELKARGESHARLGGEEEGRKGAKEDEDDIDDEFAKRFGGGVLIPSCLSPSPFFSLSSLPLLMLR